MEGNKISKTDGLGYGLKVIASGLEERRKRKEEFSQRLQGALIETSLKSALDPEAASKARLNEVQAKLYEQISSRMGGGGQGQPQPQNGLLGQPGGQISQSGGQLSPTPLGQPQWDITGASIGPGGLSATIGETPESKSQREAQQKINEELASRRQVTQEGFRRAMGLFQNLTAQFKSKISAQGGEGGILPGMAGFVSGKIKAPGSAPIEAYEGQRAETALSLNNIVTGQNRVIKGVVEMLESTLPSRWDSSEFAAQKIAQSVKNSFRLLVANNRGMLTPDIINGFENRDSVERFVQNVPLTPEEEQQMNLLVQQILDTPASETQSFGGSEQGGLNQFSGVGSGTSLESQISSQLPPGSRIKAIRRVR